MCFMIISHRVADDYGKVKTQKTILITLTLSMIEVG